MNSQEGKNGSDSGRISSVLKKLNVGSSWTRAEDRMEKSSMGVFRESPRKRVKNESFMRNKLKKTIKNHSVDENDQVAFTVPKFDKETDEAVLSRREKQIAYGKNSVDYDRYTEMVAKDNRKDRMPRTPIKHKKYSRRQWDGLVKDWKQQIHDTVNTLEGVEGDMETASKSDGRISSTGSWAEEVEAEDDFCLRTSAGSSMSSDQASNHFI